MAIGYFIHEGDRTTCDGVVLEGECVFRPIVTARFGTS